MIGGKFRKEKIAVEWPELLRSLEAFYVSLPTGYVPVPVPRQCLAYVKKDKA